MATEKVKGLRRVKITSNGLGTGTSVTDEETGEAVSDCYAFDIHAARMEPAVKVTLFCYCPTVEISADAETVEVPLGLRKRAAEILANNPNDVAKAFRDLLGVVIKPPLVGEVEFGEQKTVHYKQL